MSDRDEKSDTEPPVDRVDGEEGEEPQVEGQASEKSKAKKKKEKKKEKEKEKKEKDKEKKTKEEEKDGKKKRNKQADLIREALRRKEEAEEQLRRQAEEEERRQEEERLARELEEKMALERKEEAKRRKAEEILQQKRAGTYLTAKQREDLKRARERLLGMNVVLPDAGAPTQEGEKPKRPYYGKKKQTKAVASSSTPEPPSIPTGEATGAASEQASIDKAVKGEVTAAEQEQPLAEEEEEVAEDWEKIAEQELTAGSSKSPEGKKGGNKSATTSGAVESGKLEENGTIETSSSGEESAGETEEETPSVALSSAKETREEVFERVRTRIAERRALAEAKKDPNDLRSPVIVVLGHVDTGKTKMLDTIRRTHVQDSEAGGITQQIGATRVPAEAIKERCKMVRKFDLENIKIPGFLIIDTPGHESFANLRSRGSSLCDIAILVVDLMHGLEPQTIESLKLLKKRNTPFVVALNKIDRLYGYESNPRKDIWQHITAQPANVQTEFRERYDGIVGEFAEQGINIIHAIKNKNFDEYISVVPTSAMLGDGIGNLMAHLVEQSQSRLAQRLTFSAELDCTVMEVRVLPGLGTTIDVILVNGTLRVNDAIVLTGTDGAIVTSIRDLLMPPPLKEIRVKNDYDHYKEIKGAQGVKVLAKDLERAVAGLPLYVAQRADEIDVLREDAEEQLQRALTSIRRQAEGVYVQASTLGSLEALLEFLKSQKIPYCNVNIGPVHKLDVQKASAMLEHNPEFACILAFDVPVDKDVQLFADREGVRIFKADIIYHLEDSFLKYREELRLKRRKENEHLAIFPCKLQVLPQHIFNARNPIVCGVRVVAGTLRKGTPISACTSDGCIFLGSVSSIERNHEQAEVAKTGDEVCMKIENTTGDAPKLYGRHFTHTDPLVSKINRESIDVCKAYFREDLSKADWQLVIQLKQLLGIL